jgi:hypothetical protein
MKPDSPMKSDNFQLAWQSQASQTRVTIDADLLLKVVQRDQQNFQRMIFWRDYREVGVALVMIPVWFFLGIKISTPWTWWLTVPVLVWIAGFVLVYRIRHKQPPAKSDAPLLHCLQRSLTEVEDQIWLLDNILWWYLLPPGISIAAFFAHVSWRTAMKTNDWLGGLIFATILFVFLAGVYYFIYWVNQFAVRKQLEPRRQELLALIASLKDEPTGEDDSAKA